MFSFEELKGSLSYWSKLVGVEVFRLALELIVLRLLKFLCEVDVSVSL